MWGWPCFNRVLDHWLSRLEEWGMERGGRRGSVITQTPTDTYRLGLVSQGRWGPVQADGRRDRGQAARGVYRKAQLTVNAQRQTSRAECTSDRNTAAQSTHHDKSTIIWMNVKYTQPIWHPYRVTPDRISIKAAYAWELILDIKHSGREMARDAKTSKSHIYLLKTRIFTCYVCSSPQADITLIICLSSQGKHKSRQGNETKTFY